MPAVQDSDAARRPGETPWARVYRRRPGLWAGLAGLALYVLWAAYVSWPLLRDPGESLLGGFGDQVGSMAQMREWIEAGQIPFLPGRIPDFSAPEGLAVNWGINLGNWPYLGPAWVLSLLFGPVATFGLLTWLGLVLDGAIMQALATRVTGSRLAGIVAGFAFAFAPFLVVNAGTHAQFAHAWPLVLVVWRMVAVAVEPTRRNAVLVVLAAVLAVAFTSYYILIGGVLIATCAVLALAYSWRTGSFVRQLRIQVAVGASSLLYIAALAALALGGGGGQIREHPIAELYTYGARIHDYVVPFGASKLFGSLTAPFLQANEHGSNFSESTLYVGIVVLQLAVIALVAAFARWSPTRLRVGVLGALAIAAVGFYWSAPPKVAVAGVLLPAPSSVVEHLSSTWRVYSRFGVVVLIGTSLMAGVGLAALIRDRRRVVAVLVAALALLAIGVDFYYKPGVTPLANASPPVYRILRSQPGGILAQYPLLPAGFGDSADQFWQNAHGHPLLTGYAEDGRDDRRALSLYYVDGARTARGLASLGVRYVMVPDTPVLGTPDPGRPRGGYQRIGQGAYGASTATVYRVTAAPDPGYVYVQKGSAILDEGGPAHPFSWITEPQATLAVDAPRCPAPCSGRLRMRLGTIGPTRSVTLTGAGGRVLWRGSVAADRATRVDVPLRAGGHTELVLTSRPGPVAISSVLKGNPDPRSVTVQVSGMRFVR